MAKPTFRVPPQLPPAFTATPSSITEETKKSIEVSRGLQDKIVADVARDQATFEKVLLPIAQRESEASLDCYVLGFYQHVSPGKELRDASTEAQQLLDDFDVEAGMREDVYKLVDAALGKKEELDPESQRLLEKAHKRYRSYGLEIPVGPKRDRFKEIQKRLTELATTFQKNLNEETGGIWFDRKQLDGVPQDVLNGLKKGEGENAGKLRLTFKYPDLIPTMRFAHNAETRKTLYIGNENRANVNIPLFREAVVLRDEAARLLGYSNHATFVRTLP